MADWLDKRLGNFCQSLQEQIEELPFLDPGTKMKFIDMLEDCAAKADQSKEDSITFMRREIEPLRRQYRLKAGKELRVG